MLARSLCHLAFSPSQVVLDQPTKGMDIFDTFFLVEYLRQWAGRGRIVVMTLQPPTYEILTMISKVLLLSTGSSSGFYDRHCTTINAGHLAVISFIVVK